MYERILSYAGELVKVLAKRLQRAGLRQRKEAAAQPRSNCDCAGRWRSPPLCGCEAASSPLLRYRFAIASLRLAQRLLCLCKSVCFSVLYPSCANVNVILDVSGSLKSGINVYEREDIQWTRLQLECMSMKMEIIT